MNEVKNIKMNVGFRYRMYQPVTSEDLESAFNEFFVKPCMEKSIQVIGNMRVTQTEFDLLVEATIILPEEYSDYFAFLMKNPERDLYYMGQNLGLDLSKKYIVYDYHFDRDYLEKPW